MMRFLALSWTATGIIRTLSCWILLTMVRFSKLPLLNAVHGSHLLLANVVQCSCSHALAAAEVTLLCILFYVRMALQPFRIMLVLLCAKPIYSLQTSTQLLAMDV